MIAYIGIYCDWFEPYLMEIHRSAKSCKINLLQSRSISIACSISTSSKSGRKKSTWTEYLLDTCLCWCTKLQRSKQKKSDSNVASEQDRIDKRRFTLGNSRNSYDPIFLALHTHKNPFHIALLLMHSAHENQPTKTSALHTHQQFTF